MCHAGDGATAARLDADAAAAAAGLRRSIARKFRKYPHHKDAMSADARVPLLYMARACRKAL